MWQKLGKIELKIVGSKLDMVHVAKMYRIISKWKWEKQWFIINTILQ